MGDIADWLLASQDPFDWDGPDDHWGKPFQAKARGPVEPRYYCKFCYAVDVRWRQQGGKWVLFSLEPGKLHVCPVADDFGVVK